jgi:hypothetical protein
VEDGRCLAGGSSFVDEAGDYYVHAGGNLGFFAAYGQGNAGEPTCLLRVRAGAASIDPAFIADYRALTGSYVSYPWVRVDGNRFMARSWDPAVMLPENSDEYWDNPAFRTLLVDVDAQTATPYPGLDGTKYISGLTFTLDGASYYELSPSGYTDGGSSTVVKLGPDAAEPRFHLPGFLYGLARVR